MAAMAVKLTARTLPGALGELGDRDPDLAAALEWAGAPPLRRRPGGFATLLRIILAQQVSTASARAIFGRLEEALRPLTPEAFLGLDDGALRAIGFSRQKTAYGRHLAAALAEGRLDLKRVRRLDDAAAVAELAAVKGIGRWSGEIFLMFSLGRPDVWPADDLGLVIAMQRLKGLAERPDRKAMMDIAEAWRPWRSAAALLLWHYLHKVRDE